MPGRDLDGVHYAMDFLAQQNKRIAGEDVTNKRTDETVFDKEDPIVPMMSGTDIWIYWKKLGKMVNYTRLSALNSTESSRIRRKMVGEKRTRAQVEKAEEGTKEGTRVMEQLTRYATPLYTL